VRPALLALCGSALVALPCRYTVRDIGFVELAGPVWQLTHVEGLDSSLGELERAALEQALAGSNVRFAPTREALADEGTWLLLGAGRAPLPLDTRELTAAHTLALGSPLRSRFAEQALDSFAFLLLVEGTELAANERAWTALEEARTGLSALAPQLPRAIEVPLRSLRVEWGEREAERVLLWSMGVDLEDERPAALVLYGRGVRAGAPLVGDAITSARVLDWLALIGESCECDTERDWSAEPAFPLAWGRQDNQDVSAALGFDPESPWVQREVASILQRGAWTKPPGSGAQALEQDALAAVLGFRVGELAGTGQEPTGLPHHDDPESGALLVRGEGSGDWDFADEPRVVTPGAGRADELAWPASAERSERVSDLPTQESPSLVRVSLALGALALLSLGGAVLVALTRARR